MANPREIVEMLDRRKDEISLDEFKQHFDTVLAATSDVDTLSRVMWLAGLYLQTRHPGAFQLPRPLAEQFLASANFDHLLAGLKGIRQSSADISEVVLEYMKVMKRDDWQHKDAGLCQLHQVVADHGPAAIEKLDHAQQLELRTVLEQIDRQADDVLIRECVAYCFKNLDWPVV
jgi:hypothetical protein